MPDINLKAQASVKRFVPEVFHWAAPVTGNSGDIVVIRDLPKNFVVDLLFVTWNSTTSGTIKIGDRQDDDRFLASTSINAAGSAWSNNLTTFNGALLNQGTGFKTVNATGSELIMTLGGANPSNNVMHIVGFGHYDGDAPGVLV